MTQAELTEPFEIGGVPLANRVLLAPLAGIGNWFVRLQARRHGAGLTVSEMVSSHALHYRNQRTLEQLLVIHPDEHPVAIQLFGADPLVMEDAARIAADAGADLIDLNMGCPVKKVLKTGAGASLLADPDLAVEVALAAARGSGLPVTVKLRSGLEPGDTSGLGLAIRLVEEGGAAAIGFHPRPATVHHKGEADYGLVRELVDQVGVPVIVSGGLQTAALAREAYAASRADAVMIARGSFGYPWIFEELLSGRDQGPTQAEVAGELDWIVDRAIEHFGERRACHYLRKFYPWYLERLDTGADVARQVQAAESTAQARSLIHASLTGFPGDQQAL